MKNYWSGLNERERWMVGIAGICLIVYLFYLLIYAPLKNSVIEKSTQLVEKKDTVVWMQQAKKRKHSTITRKTISNSQLLTLLSDRLKADNLQKYNHQIEQTGAGDIQLSFNEVPFKALLQWLEDLNKNYAMTIKQLNAERSETTGMVKLTLVISAGS
ncbi:type II secretion system protein M [Legionella israelensis]|uniref:Type II secretion system protein M n=1 Tax=Legionella israelensis TaxID=454 RepID=A0AAX1EF69_9GAMM|nr:type II secretion system protein M [Legionella israelensis]QBR83672.1 type II secretion system protein M [Legionella israelensis]